MHWGSTTYMIFTTVDPTYHTQFLSLYLYVGKFALVEYFTTVPLTPISYIAIFFQSLNVRIAGTPCIESYRGRRFLFSRMKEQEKLMNLIDIYKACHTDTLVNMVSQIIVENVQTGRLMLETSFSG